MSAARFAYLNARVAMLASRLMTPAQVERFLEQTGTEGGDQGALAEVLGEPAARHVRLEQGLLSQVMRDFQVIARPVWGQERDVLIYGIHWFEMVNLKTILRGKVTGQPEPVIRQELVDVGPFSSLPIDALLRTEDPAEMLRRLENTPYADIARQARRVYEERKDLFSVDATIDRRFFAELQRRARGVTPSQRQALIDLLGTILDRFNLSWLLRYRFSYGLPPAETYYLLAPAGRQLNSDRLLALAQLGSVAEVVQALPAAVQEGLGETATIAEVDAHLQEMVLQVAERHVRDARHPLARAFAYLVLREHELRRVTAILKGRRMGFAPDLIRVAAGLEGP